MTTNNTIVWDHWHIEVSSVCALKCPRCPRVEVPESLLNRQLSLDFFKTQLGYETIKEIKKITFCGNDGDPIYCKEFLEICEWIKQSNPDISVVIITNGSHKSTQWWTTLGTILNHNDEIHWSLDGWDQISNEQYRINSNWDSISAGIKAFSNANNTSYKVWASIGFRFNQSNIGDQEKLAIDWGFDLFQLTKSTKFGSNYPGSYSLPDYLEPTDAALIATNHRFERVLTTLTPKVRPGAELKILFFDRAQTLIKEDNYSGICLIGNKGVFLNSLGELYPCCWTANRYEHNRYWNMLATQKFNLYKRTFNDVITDPFWTTDFLNFNKLECKSKCTKEKLHDISHTTEW